MAPPRLFRTAAAVAVALAAPAAAMRYSEEKSFDEANAGGADKQELPPDWKPPGYNCPYNIEGGPHWHWYFIQKHDQQIERNIRSQGREVVEEVNECCRSVQLVPETACELVTCDKRDERSKQLYKSSLKKCDPSTTYNDMTMNSYPIDTYSQYCPDEKPLCTDQVLKSGTFGQVRDGADLGESREFLSSGHLTSIHYELEANLPWYNVTGFKPSDKCTFAILQLQAGESKWSRIGKFASGEPIGPIGCDNKQLGCGRVAVNRGDRLVWWDCDIKTESRDYVNKVQQEVQKETWDKDLDSVVDLGGPAFRLHGGDAPIIASVTMKFFDFRPTVEAKYVVGMHSHELKAAWSVPFGDTIQFRLQHWDLQRLTWVEIEHAKVVGDADVNYLERNLDAGTDYRFTFKNLHEEARKALTFPGTHVYLRTETNSCPQAFKCCQFLGDEGKPSASQCARKRTFLKTCGALTGPNGERAQGARDADGKYDETICTFCDEGMKMPKDMAKAYQRYKKPACEALAVKVKAAQVGVA